MVELRLVKPQEKELLWNIHQKYLYEMTNYYDDKMDETGNYQYGYFDAYFIEPERKALFLYNDEQLIGFAMVNPYSYINGHPDYVLAEFTIFPAFRKRHLAAEAVKKIFDRYQGSWEIKYNEKNAPARELWTKTTAKYRPQKTSLNDEETVLSFHNDGQMDVCDFWKAVLSKDRLKLPSFFHDGASIRWHCSNEQFTVDEYIRANCDYPGEWEGELERIEKTGDLMILAGRVFPKDKSASFHVVSFIKVRNGRIAEMDEYWSDDGNAPDWRKDMKIGKPIR